MAPMFHATMFLSALFSHPCNPCTCHNGTMYCNNVDQLPILMDNIRFGIHSMYIYKSEFSHIPSGVYPNLTHLILCNNTFTSPQAFAHISNQSGISVYDCPLSQPFKHSETLTPTNPLELLLIILIVVILTIAKVLFNTDVIKNLRLSFKVEDTEALP